MTRDYAGFTATNAEAVIELTTAAQRALAGRINWTPVDAATAVRAEMLPF